jgi:hypothetical protein
MRRGQSDDDNEDAAKGKKRSKRKRKGGDESSDRSDSDSSEDSDDDEMRAKLKAVMGVGRDGISCTATADEQRIAQRMAKDSWGRWGGREGKMARIRAAEAEFMAKHHPGAAKEAAAKQAAADAAVEAAKATKESGSASSSKERKKQAKKSKGEKVKKVKMSGAAAAEAAIEPVKGFVCHAAVQAVAQRQARGGDGGAGVGGGGEGGGGLGLGRRAMAAMTAMTAAMSKALPTPASWWGAKVFVSAGLLGEQLEERAAQAEAKVAAKKRGFTEGDQESLFNLTHDGKSSGKKGLGRGQPGALNLGSDYTGKKFAFEEAAEEGGAEKEDNRGEGSSGGGGGGSGSAEVEALKWKKEMRKALEEAPGRSLSVKRLQKAVLAALAGKSSASTKQLKAAFKEKLEGSSMFRVDGDEVALVSKSDHGGASKSKPGKKTKR